MAPKKLWEMTVLGPFYGKYLRPTLLRQLNFTNILLKCHFITIVFAINILENISEQLFSPGKHLQKAVLEHQAYRKTDQINFFILNIPFLTLYGNVLEIFKERMTSKSLFYYYLFSTMGFVSST